MSTGERCARRVEKRSVSDLLTIARLRAHHLSSAAKEAVSNRCISVINWCVSTFGCGRCGITRFGVGPVRGTSCRGKTRW
jgi:hypothetical protein